MWLALNHTETSSQHAWEGVELKHTHTQVQKEAPKSTHQYPTSPLKWHHHLPARTLKPEQYSKLKLNLVFDTRMVLWCRVWVYCHNCCWLFRSLWHGNYKVDPKIYHNNIIYESGGCQALSSDKWKQPADSAWQNVLEKWPKSLGSIVWGPQMSVQNFMTINQWTVSILVRVKIVDHSNLKERASVVVSILS